MEPSAVTGTQSQRRSEGRPYRSHKFPACTTCRHRKGRCHVDDPALPCRYCRQRSLACDHGISARDTRIPRHHAGRRAQEHVAEPTTGPTGGGSSLPRISFDEMHTPSESSPVMVDPTMADDLDVLERHLASQTAADGPGTQRYVRISNSPGE